MINYSLSKDFIEVVWSGELRGLCLLSLIPSPPPPSFSSLELCRENLGTGVVFSSVLMLLVFVLNMLSALKAGSVI